MLELKKRLMDNPQHIINILNIFEFHNIEKRNNEIRCGLDENTNNTSIRIKLNKKLSANDFARDIHGDLFSLIMKLKKITLREVFKVIKSELNISHIDFNNNKKIFGGFYDSIKRRNNGYIELKKYDVDILRQYENKYNTLFLKDGIDLDTQKRFNVGLCHLSSRITVPWFNYEGDLVGIEGRYVGDYKKDETSKWFPIIPFPKSQVLYGYYINYEYLHECEEVYIGESSKFTMQLDSWGIHTGLALGGNSIHTQQIKQLSWLNPKKIIFCFDEGLEKDHIERQVKKVKVLMRYFNVKIGFVYDKENVILHEGSKNSPSDLGFANFKELINKYVIWEVN